MKQFIIISFILLLSGQSGITQNNQIVIGEALKVHSKILNEDRNLMVYVPADYKTTQTKYSVIYLLDGPDHFHHMTGIVRFLAQEGVIPDMIVVAVANTNRTRDLTPKTDSSDVEFSKSGGADRFLQFLTEELMPYVQKNYRTDPYKILIGHSFGGLFAIHTMLNNPDAFNAYIAVSPSLWWNQWEEVKHAESFLKAHPDFKKSLYVTLGHEGDQMQNPMDSFVTVLKNYAPPGFLWKYNSMNKENHSTTPHRSIYDGLEWMYEGWALTQTDVNSGLSGLERHYAQLSEKFGYAMEPSEALVNTFGYGLLRNVQFTEAIKVFQFNIRKHPESANVYDSMADAYEFIDELDLALQNCEQACKNSKKISDPNLPFYKKHLENVKKKIGKM